MSDLKQVTKPKISAKDLEIINEAQEKTIHELHITIKALEKALAKSYLEIKDIESQKEWYRSEYLELLERANKRLLKSRILDNEVKDND